MAKLLDVLLNNNSPLPNFMKRTQHRFQDLKAEFDELICPRASQLSFFIFCVGKKKRECYWTIHPQT